ncbi:hypothetical protein EZH22_13075 [Xanthobacter dioxanivorans]|uniref:Uncharacterized protein n=1 Tax=Xanthobacter dioxanivorans TaxID=2528964 RepID=A0A974SKR4_9HYPH|nr:hypothetical protein [Xanthobacter dioxanivorans]QRG09115.1 hypothetical protein EZH22_13075 [Xanthobacter dioxanivorans]
MTEDERSAVAGFLDSVLALDLAPAELMRVWNDHCDGYYIRPGEGGSRPDVLFAFIRDTAREMNGAK